MLSGMKTRPLLFAPSRLCVRTDFHAKAQRREAMRARRGFLLAALIFALALVSSACGKSRAGAFAYVSNERAGTVTVIDTRTDKVVSTIPVGARPRGIRVSPDNKLIYIALSYPSNKREGEDKIAAIDVASEKIVEKIDVGERPRALRREPRRQAHLRLERGRGHGFGHRR
jgi:YVTN family beta-propeller protein